MHNDAMLFEQPQQIAVIGAGISGAACARALTQAGHSVHVFDKSRGPGGRLATRRMQWIDKAGLACTTRLDHGAIGFTARSQAFQGFVDSALHTGYLAQWSPRLADGSLPLEDASRLYVPVTEMPALCRHLLDGASASWSFGVDRLVKSSLGWHVEAGGERHAQHFDAVVLAIPPTQAAPLLRPHRHDWAQRSSAVAMQPCWTLMGVADAPEPALSWDWARPPTGPLSWVLRNDARPGRQPVPGQAHWVAHARTEWSNQHLEHPAEQVQQQLQSALAEWLGRPINWHHCVVHRWRYALPPTQTAAPGESCWWDAAQGLGVCGDFFGSLGVESGWLSAQSLSGALLKSATDPAGAPSMFVARSAVQPARNVPMS